jgi:uncharacterized protein (UPF0218 family)
VATTEKLAALPAVTVAALGWVVIAGGVFMVSVAALLVTDPAPFVTTTV